jgi:hypothetical protein
MRSAFSIVNVSRIQALEPLSRGEYCNVLRDGISLTSGRTYRERLEHLLTSSFRAPRARDFCGALRRCSPSSCSGKKPKYLKIKHTIAFVAGRERPLGRWRKPLTQARLASECKIVRLDQGWEDGSGS